MHRTIDGVSADYVAMAYNTAIAKLIVLTSHLTKSGAPVPRSVAEALVLMTAPLAPHISEEMWQRLGHSESLAHGPFPVADPALLVAETFEYPIQVKGKVRARITVAADAAGRRMCRRRRWPSRGSSSCWPVPLRARSLWCRGRWSRSFPDIGDQRMPQHGSGNRLDGARSDGVTTGRQLYLGAYTAGAGGRAAGVDVLIHDPVTGGWESRAFGQRIHRGDRGADRGR